MRVSTEQLPGGMMEHPSLAPIGIFDSGVGGLSVWREVRKQLPQENLIYIADQAHVPYGPRPLEEVRHFSEEITRYLLRSGAKLIVVACNTASAAALHSLRQRFPGVPFVGMEPAVKPAAQNTHSGVVGVLATPATFQGELYASLVERFSNGVTILKDTCPGLVTQIEAGLLDSDETRSILEKALTPMLAQGLDTVVMGCTHYPFVIPLIREITGPGPQLIDPAPAVARQTRRLLTSLGKLNNREEEGTSRFLTSGSSQQMEALLRRLVGVEAEAERLSL